MDISVPIQLGPITLCVAGCGGGGGGGMRVGSEQELVHGIYLASFLLELLNWTSFLL